MEERPAEELGSRELDGVDTEQSDEEWAESRRLRLLRRRRLIAALALIGVILLLALGILAKASAGH